MGSSGSILIMGRSGLVNTLLVTASFLPILCRRCPRRNAVRKMLRVSPYVHDEVAGQELSMTQCWLMISDKREDRRGENDSKTEDKIADIR